ncbi:MAG: PD-(D/E)XK nuclease family protein [Pirellulales bacterium]|nr:PD-(D/E)XK nuclease family protein [Pirellulales bacterium]
MPVRRLFTDWVRPALASAADYLATEYCFVNVIDLSGAIVVLPNAEAARRLIELLVAAARERGCRLVPPRRTLTIGELPEMLYVNRRPFAGSLVQRLAWRRAFSQLPQRRRKLLVPQPPADDDLFAWLALGQLFADVHAELAGDGLTCADVVDAGTEIFARGERERWQALAELENRYLAALDATGTWDKQTARLVALERHECKADFEIVLVGTVDLPRTQRAMIEAVAEHVTSLVFAPRKYADRFDELGCLIPEKWSDAELDVAADLVEVAAGPGDQADAAVRWLAELEGRYAADEIAIGLPDASLAPFLLQRLAEADVPARRVVGREAAATPVGLLLQAIAQLVESRRFADFAALLRHPDIECWLARSLDRAPAPDERDQDDLLTAADRYYARHLPYELAAEWFHTRDGATVERAYRAVARLLAPLRRAPQPPGDWGEPILAIVREIYGDRNVDRNDPQDHELEVACEAIVNAVGELELAGAALLADKISGAAALRLVVEGLAMALPPAPSPPAIRLTGWLELPLDDAPVAVVTSFNEGLVPQARNGDFFLPNELRRRLGVVDNQRRYARDAYALSLLAASRERLQIIVGRRTADGEPLFPSRLLFACPDAELAERVRTWFRAAPLAASAPAAHRLRPGRATPAFAVPKPEPLAEPITALRVTEFRDYLECPYRYYLRQQLELERLDDSGDELAAPDFGSLLHAVLAEWGASDARDITSADELEAEFNRLLDEIVDRSYGRASMPAVRLQIEQLRLRLGALARWQADWRRQGWRVVHTELEFRSGDVDFVVDGQPLALVGRVDRIDRHEGDGVWAMFDYKTGDKATSPDEAHRGKAGAEWLDLQLPLYRHLARSLGIDGEIRLGYIVLPKDLDQTGALVAEWSGDDLAAAEATAAEVVRNIRAGRFWPPTTPAPAWRDDLAAICQDDQLGRALELEDEDDDAEESA